MTWKESSVQFKNEDKEKKVMSARRKASRTCSNSNELKHPEETPRVDLYGNPVIGKHSTWDYLIRRFGSDVVAIEPSILEKFILDYESANDAPKKKRAG